MREQRTVADIFELLKDDLSKEIEGNVYDYHLSDALGTSYNYIAISKKRNTVNYQLLLDYCIKRDLDLNYILARGEYE